MAIPVQNEEYKTRGTGELDKEVKISLFFLLVSIFLWFIAYNGITTAFSRYAIAVWDMYAGQVARSLMLAAIAAIITYIPSGFLGTKIGRRKAILLGICLFSTTYLLGIILATFSALVYLSFAIMGVGWAFINVNSLPMIVEMSHVADVGKYTGMYYTASMAAQIVTPFSWSCWDCPISLCPPLLHPVLPDHDFSPARGLFLERLLCFIYSDSSFSLVY
ncbi:TPA: MFS transporter [Streptococcus suis]